MKDINQIEVGKSLRKFFKEQGISTNKAARDCDLSPSQMQNILDGKNYGVKYLFTIMNIFPEWNFPLQYINKNKTENIAEPKTSYFKKSILEKRLPLVKEGELEAFIKGENQNEDLYLIPEFASAEFLYRINGNSMSPLYNHGDLVACKTINPASFIQWYKVHLMDTTQGTLLKRIAQGENNNTYLLSSENPEHPSFGINKENIKSLHLVVGSLRVE